MADIICSSHERIEKVFTLKVFVSFKGFCFFSYYFSESSGKNGHSFSPREKETNGYPDIFALSNHHVFEV